MIFSRATLAERPPGTDAVVIIDVCRAFTTAPYALACGADRIVLVQTVEEAFQLRAQNPDWLLMGEVDGLPVPGFDLWNSPYQVEGQDLARRTLVQRTSSGTQGVVRSQGAPLLLAGSFVVARATVNCLRREAPASVAFVLTGVRDDRSGEEDAACADYMEALFADETTSADPYLQAAGVWDLHRITHQPDLVEHLQQDLARCLQADRFDFCLRVRIHGGYPVLSLAPAGIE